MILVSGATGTIGRYVVKHLKASGQNFKALVRDEAKGRALDCDYVVGDFDEPDTIERALRGVTRFFLNGNAGDRMVQQQNTAIDLAARAGVALVVKVSSRGASLESSLGPARWHAEIEAHLKESGVGGVILQPTVFMQNLFRNADMIRSQRKIVGSFRDGKIAFIDCDDIGACAATVLTGPARSGESCASYVLTGGEALTYDDVARTLSAKLGETVTYVDLPVEQFVANATAGGLPAPMAQFVGKMMAILATGGAAGTTVSVRELLGREPRNLDAFLDDNAAVFRGDHQ